jgi:hypothetical protein
MTRRIVLVVVSVLVALVTMVAIVTAQQSAPARTSGPEIGRYQVFINPQIRADTFLLDTATGRIWTPGRYEAFVDEPRVWELQTKVDSETQLRAFLATQKLKAN